MTENTQRILNVLDWAGDEENRYLWIHIWNTQQTDIEKELEKKEIKIITEYPSGFPIVTRFSASLDVVVILLQRSFNRRTQGKRAVNLGKQHDLSDVEINNLTELFRSDQVGFYKDTVSACVWLVCSRENVDDYAKKFPDNVDYIRSKHNVNKPLYKINQSSEPFEHISPLVKICLTRQEQATIWLHNLFDLECIKGGNVHVDCNGFDIELSVMDTQVSRIRIEQEIKSKLSSPLYNVTTCKEPLSSRFVSFLGRPKVDEYIRLKLQVDYQHVDAVWFLEGSEYIVYAKQSSVAKQKYNKIKELILEAEIPIPLRYFSTVEAKQKLQELESSFHGKIDIQLGKTLSLLYTSNSYEAPKKIQNLFGFRTVYISSFRKSNCKNMFEKLEHYIGEKYMVDLCEKEKDASYCWILSGETSKVQSAYNELEKLKETITSETKTFHTDETKDIVLAKLQCIQENNVHVIIRDTLLPATGNTMNNQIDLADCVKEHFWQFNNETVVRLYQSNIRQCTWILKDSIVIEILPVTEQNPVFSIRPFENCIVATIYLPVWEGSVNKEKAILRSHLYTIMKHVIAPEGSKLLSMTFDLTEVDKVKWPRTKFVKQILAVVLEKKPPIPIHFHEPDVDQYRSITDLIEGVKQASSCSGKPLKICVKKGELIKEDCDVIVNSTSNDLQLTSGTVSKSILKHAGPQIQDECDELVRNKKPISYTEVAVTDGYKLSCKKVFHGTLPFFQNDKQQILQKFIRNCLCQAAHEKMKSIAFPALGTGNLGYPPGVTAKAMFDTVEMFEKDGLAGSLSEVLFVIYPADMKAIEAFEKEEKKRQEKAVTWKEKVITSPDCISLSISVTGTDEESVQNAFQQIKDCLTLKNRKEAGTVLTCGKSDFYSATPEPVDQRIERDADLPLSDTVRRLTDEKTNMDTIEEPDNSFMPPESYSRQNSQDLRIEPCYLNVQIVNADLDPQQLMHHIMKKNNINDEQLIWSSQFPLQARLKFKREADADQCLEYLASEKNLKVTKSILDAVINIRAKLNSATKEYLLQGSMHSLLKKESGVEIEDYEGDTILMGDLTAISAARCILLNWKAIGFTESAQNQNYSNIPDNISNAGLQIETKQMGVNKAATKGKSDQVSINQNDNAEEAGELTAFKTLHNSENIVQINNNHTQPDADLEQRKYLNHEGNNSKVEKDKIVDTTYDKSAGAIPKKQTQNFQVQATTTICMMHDKDNNTHRIGQQNLQHGKQSKYENYQHEQKPLSPVRFKPNQNDLMMTTKEGIKVFVYKADICLLYTDCIVNTSNERMKHEHGLSWHISKEAGQSMEVECREYIQKHKTLKAESVCVTSAGRLSHYKNIFHINAPRFDQSTEVRDFASALSTVVRNSLVKANKKNMSSVALPAISSGYGGAPKDIQFTAYPKGVLEFSMKISKNSTLKEVHFIDRDQDVVDYIQAAFVQAGLDIDEDCKKRWPKIPERIRKIFRPKIRSIEQAGKSFILEFPESNMVAVVCDSSLISSTKHQHIQDLMRSVGSSEFKHDQTGIIITEDVKFNNISSSSKTYLDRSGQKYKKDRNEKKKGKRSPGDVVHLFGDEKLEFYHVFTTVMPPFSDAAQKKNSNDQKSFFEKIDMGLTHALEESEKIGIRHLSMPILFADFYSCTEKWFCKIGVFNMISVIQKFAKKRGHQKSYMIVHIVTNSNEKLFQIMFEEMSKESMETSL